jgi:C3HC zinc finger-like
VYSLLEGLLSACSPLFAQLIFVYFSLSQFFLLLLCQIYRWRNVAPNMLTCDECQQALALVYFPQLSGKAYRKLTCLYEDQLSTAHRPSCSYRDPAACCVQAARSAAAAAAAANAAEGENTCTATATNSSVSLSSSSENGLLVPASVAAAAPSRAPPPPPPPAAEEHEAPLIVPPLLERLFTRQDLHLLDHAYPVRPFYDIAQNFHQHLQQLLLLLQQDKQKQLHHHHQQQLLVLQLPKFETTKNLLLYYPRRSILPGCDISNLVDQKTLLERLVELLVTTTTTTTTTTGTNNKNKNITDWMKGQSTTHLESLAALVLLGWRPPSTAAAAAASAVVSSGTDDSSSSSLSSTSGVVVFSASCPLCLASIAIELVPAFGGGSSSCCGVLQRVEQRQQQQEEQMHPLNKNKRRRTNNASYCNPVTGHKYYCPYVIGFPINGANEAKPLWQSLADRLLSPQQPNQKETVSLESQGEESGEKNISSTQPGAWERIRKLLASGIARKKGNIAYEVAGLDD